MGMDYVTVIFYNKNRHKKNTNFNLYVYIYIYKLKTYNTCYITIFATSIYLLVYILYIPGSYAIPEFDDLADKLRIKPKLADNHI